MMFFIVYPIALEHAITGIRVSKLNGKVPEEATQESTWRREKERWDLEHVSGLAWWKPQSDK